MFIPSLSRIHVNHFPLEGYSVPSICFQCPHPDCLEACPQEAIHRDDSGVVRVDNDKCDICGDCVQACPYGMLTQLAGRVPFKCDTCDGDPACVRECEPGALVFQEPDKALMKARGFQMKQKVGSSSPEQKRHQLGLALLSEAREDR
jgi:Fe-S-cluster-containing dehydrogenase component